MKGLFYLKPSGCFMDPAVFNLMVFMIQYNYMARYKVPQDVEADDKLLGPFSFRQFVYLLIAGALVAIGVGLFQLFPLLAIIPLPLVLFFAALALPLKKDQPMETYLAAVASYYLKPKNRLWVPGQRESTITITAPKITEDDRTRDITSEEATHRLSFLADIVDTEGYAIKSGGMNHANMQLAAEADRTRDMFEVNKFGRLEDAMQRDENQRYEEAVQGMQDEIRREREGSTRESALDGRLQSSTREPTLDGRLQSSTREPAQTLERNVAPKSERRPEPEWQPSSEPVNIRNPRNEGAFQEVEADFNSAVVVQPEMPKVEKPVEKPKKVETKSPSPSIIELANNNDYTVATIAKEANRIKERDEGEVFISLR